MEAVQVKEPTAKPAEPEEGYLFVDIGAIYFANSGSLLIRNSSMDTLIFFKHKKAYVDGGTFETIDEEYLYEDYLPVWSFDPEYGMFILECNGLDEQGNYKVIVDGELCFIEKEAHKNLLDFKSNERFVLEGSPYLVENRELPLRKEPKDEAEIIKGFHQYTYVSVEIQGDWLKVRDDKECYIGAEPSPVDIIGWVRWRKDGVIILDIRHLC